MMELFSLGADRGAYTQEEKANRSIFLERLAAVYHEENKTSEAIATYQKMIDLGGDPAKRGYQGEVDTYRDAKMFDKATEICRKAVAANPDDHDMKLLLAWELADTGKLDEGLALAGIGLIIGLIGAYFVGRGMQSTLYGIGKLDLSVFGSVALLLLCAAVIACLVPARRAASVEPMQALRAE